LFGDIDVAGSEGEDVEVATSARGVPVLPGATAYDDKPTGQRNENSVLFSLDSLKAGFVAPAPAAKDKGSKPSAPKPGAPRPTQPSNPDDPFGMGASSDIAGLGSGSSPLFTLNANQALLTAPAPPEPKPVVMPTYSAATSAGVGGMDPKTKKLVMFGGIGAGAVILLLLGIVVFGGDKKKEEASAGDDKALASAKPDVKKEEPKEEPKAEEKKEEPKAAASAAPSEEKKDETKPDAAKPDATKVGGQVTAKKEEPKKEEPAGASTAPPFSKASAISALTGAAGAAGGCKKPGGPTGTGKVQVTFAPSGRVTSATVMGAPFAGTAVGGCVASAFRRAKVPAFSGNAVTVSKSFAIN
jgi:Sec-independent protein translocase protein TatA